MIENIIITSGRAHIKLAKEIAKHCRVPFTEINFKNFHDGDWKPKFPKTIRGLTVFIVQPTNPVLGKHMGENLYELLVINDAAMRASADEVIAVIPYYGAARQDRKDEPRVPITARLNADLIVNAGITKVITMDLHVDQIQGFFNIPVDNLYGSYFFIPLIKELNIENLAFSSADVGGARRAEAYARRFKTPLIICYKNKVEGEIEKIVPLGDIKGKNVQVVRMDGLKNIKCFGSSRSFANHMKEIPGIVGVETFVKHHSVVVYFDKKIIGEEAVKEAIFSPLSELLNFKGKATGMVSFVKLGIDRCFDPNDQFYLGELLRKDKGIYALSTRFGEPVQATIYYDSSLTDENNIRKAVSMESLIMGEGKDQTSVKTGFAVNEAGNTTGEIPAFEFLSMFIATTDVAFNKYESYTEDKMLVYELPFGQAADPEMQKWMPFLVSHASNDDGIVRIQTSFTESGPVIKIWFVDSMTTVEKINSVLNSPEFLIHYPDKSVKRIKNPFKFLI